MNLFSTKKAYNFYILTFLFYGSIIQLTFITNFAIFDFRQGGYYEFKRNNNNIVEAASIFATLRRLKTLQS